MCFSYKCFHLKGDTVTKILNISSTTQPEVSNNSSPANATVSSAVDTNLYRCNLCSFTSVRQNLMVFHRKTHSSSNTANNCSANSVSSTIKNASSSNMHTAIKHETSIENKETHESEVSKSNTRALFATPIKKRIQNNTSCAQLTSFSDSGLPLESEQNFDKTFNDDNTSVDSPNENAKAVNTSSYSSSSSFIDLVGLSSTPLLGSKNKNEEAGLTKMEFPVKDNTNEDDINSATTPNLIKKKLNEMRYTQVRLYVYIRTFFQNVSLLE